MFCLKIRSFLTRKKGAMLVEYGLIVGLIAMGVLASSFLLGDRVRITFCIAATEIQENLGMEVTGDCQDSDQEVVEDLVGTPVLNFSPVGLTEAEGVFVLNSQRTVPYSLDLSSYLSTENIDPSGVTWSISGDVPPGFTLDPQTGVFSGTPSQVQNYAFNITFGNEELSQSLPFAMQVEELFVESVVTPRRNASYYTVYPASGTQSNICKYFYGNSAGVVSYTNMSITSHYRRMQSFHASGWGGTVTWSTGNLTVINNVTCRYPAP